MTTVLIVGAGPAGLTLAIELTRYGVPVRIVDKAAERTSKSKALVVWSRTLELLARSGGAAAFVEAGHPVHAATVSAGDNSLGRITFEGIASPYPFALMIPQSETERLLETQLAAMGVLVERQSELVSFQEAVDGVRSTLRSASGAEEVVETVWLAGCDGAHSTVRHQLAKEFAGDMLPSDWILADVHLAGVAGPPTELELIWHEDGMLAIFPIAGGRYRVIADAGAAGDEAPRPDPTLADVQAIVDRRGHPGMRAFDPVWLASFRISERKVADYRDGRIFLAGDAAHIHSPAGGQGMNTGMQDAFNLAWKLAFVAAGLCRAEPLLSTYSEERSPVATQLLAATGRLTAIAVAQNPLVQFARNHAAQMLFGLSAVRDKMADAFAELSVGYPDSRLSRSVALGAAPRPGSRAPIRAGEAPPGAGSRPRFALCAAPAPDARRLIAENPDVLEPELRPPFAPSGLWLVRPDGYVGLSAAADAWDDVPAYLNVLGADPHSERSAVHRASSAAPRE